VNALLTLALMMLIDIAGGRSRADVQSNLSLSASLPETCQSTAETSPELAALLKDVKTQPTAGAFAALGLQFAKQDQQPCAIAAFRAALRLDPASWQDHYNLGLALAHTGDQKQAAAELRVAVQQKPDYFPARHALGMALQSLGDLDAAAEQFQAALRIDPGSGAAAFGLAQVYGSQKKDFAAIYYLRQTLASSPPRQLEFQSRLALAAIEDQLGHGDEAVAELRKLVTAFPDSAEAHYNLANAYSRHFRYAEARPEYEQTLRLDPGNNAARLSFAKALLEISDNSAAIPLVADYIRHAPGDFEGYVVLGQAYRRSNDLANAEAQLRRAANLKPDSYEARYQLGLVLAATGKIEEAADQLAAAEKLNPHAPGVHYELSVLYKRMNDPRRSQEEAKIFQQVRDEADNARTFDLLRLKGDDSLQKGDTQGAAKTYREAIALNPDDPGIHYDLSLALAKLGDQVGEKEELEKAVKLGPNVPEPHNQLGTLYLAEGRVPEAEQQFKSAIAANPAFAEAKNNLGTLYGRMGKNRAAMELFREAVENNPEFAQAHANLGLSLAAAGNFTEARLELEKALRFDLKNATALAGLQMLKTQEPRGPLSKQAN
jgi:tetratricopeptide (TPR) repeat protein